MVSCEECYIQATYWVANGRHLYYFHIILDSLYLQLLFRKLIFKYLLNSILASITSSLQINSENGLSFCQTASVLSFWKMIQNKSIAGFFMLSSFFCLDCVGHYFHIWFTKLMIGQAKLTLSLISFILSIASNNSLHDNLFLLLLSSSHWITNRLACLLSQC